MTVRVTDHAVERLRERSPAWWSSAKGHQLIVTLIKRACAAYRVVGAGRYPITIKRCPYKLYAVVITDGGEGVVVTVSKFRLHDELQNITSSLTAYSKKENKKACQRACRRGKR